MSKLIIVTGAAGFIGCNLIRQLNTIGHKNLVLVDKFDYPQKQGNLDGLIFEQKIERGEFVEWLRTNYGKVQFIFHLGARTDTTEFDMEVFNVLNLNYSKAIWEICTDKQIPLLYASSAATYGMGEHGFEDDYDLIPSLKPLNPYGLSKQLFDLYVLQQKKHPPHWAGLKFFNVYGPHEAHKGRMASVAFHAYRQIKERGSVKLFKSHRPDFKDGEQLRDFIYVNDVIDVCLFFMNRFLPGKSELPAPDNDIYNLGSGKARTFNELVKNIFSALNKNVQIDYIPIPEDIRERYQYFTEAKMDKLRAAGCSKPFKTLEEGVQEYVDFLDGTSPANA